MSISQIGNHASSPPSTSVRIRVPDPANGRWIAIEGRDPGLPEVWVLDRHKKINEQMMSTIYLLVMDMSPEGMKHLLALPCISKGPGLRRHKGRFPLFQQARCGI